jgi:hypothetical protein
MRRVGAGAAAAALIMGLGVAVATGQVPVRGGGDAEPRGLLSGLFAGKSKTPSKVATKVPEELSQQPSMVEATASQLNHYRNALLRRLEVCDRLRNIADQTGNEALMNQADVLEARANELYRQQTAGLPQVATPILANDSQPSGRLQQALDVSRGRDAPRGEAPALLSSPDRGGLDGSMERREQAILNGSSMGGERP